MKGNYILRSAAFLLLAGCIAIKPTERIEFTAYDVYPEGIAYDKNANVYYVSSARTGTVGRVTPSGQYTPLLADSNLRSTYGMKIHPDGRRLFVCVSDANYSRYSTPSTRNKLAKLISVDLNSGKKLAEIDLSGLVQDKHFINDLTFDSSGNMYVTDSYADAIYKVATDGKASVFSQSPLFKTEGIGINGLVYHPDGYLLVSSTGTGHIYKVPMSSPNNVQKVKTPMYFIGGDGMLLNDNNHITLCVNGGSDKIFRLKSEDGWRSARLDRTTLIADRFTYPATATFAGDDIWIMNAKFHDLNDSTTFPSSRFAIQKVVFKPIPKKFNEQ